MYFSKLPIGFFDLNTDTETLHSLLYEHFNKTIKKRFQNTISRL